jgi:hypothetical protein
MCATAWSIGTTCHYVDSICPTIYRSPYWCSVPNIRKLAFVVPEKYVTEIILWPQRHLCNAGDTITTTCFIIPSPFGYCNVGPIWNCQYNWFVVWKIFEYCTFGSDQKIASIHWHTLIQDPFWNISVCNGLLNRDHLPPMLTRCSLPVGLGRFYGKFCKGSYVKVCPLMGACRLSMATMKLWWNGL